MQKAERNAFFYVETPANAHSSSTCMEKSGCAGKVITDRYRNVTGHSPTEHAVPFVNLPDTSIKPATASRQELQPPSRRLVLAGRQFGGSLLEQRHQGGGLFASDGRARRGGGAKLLNVDRICAKRWVNTNVCYLIQWAGYHELTWGGSLRKTSHGNYE
ncbi:hypothetical protein ON010_g13224 [Phytophthora cinnamomi]|nr:hypothetical protein ON010_g13224 [Phytophthora cinnamomi]